jgi:hypothetical protein
VIPGNRDDVSAGDADARGGKTAKLFSAGLPQADFEHEKDE